MRERHDPTAGPKNFPRDAVSCRAVAQIAMAATQITRIVPGTCCPWLGAQFASAERPTSPHVARTRFDFPRFFTRNFDLFLLKPMMETLIQEWDPHFNMVFNDLAEPALNPHSKPWNDPGMTPE